MLFKTRFHDGIRNGVVTATVRAWRSPRVAVGKTYRLGESGRIKVDALDGIALGDIRREDARDAGFDTTEELVRLLKKESRRSLNRRSRVYRVRFHFVGDETLEPPARPIEDVLALLERMDHRSRSGPWTIRLLKTIRIAPGVAAARLAEELGREKARLKADVRKLKKLGLTRSLEVGYELTEMGEAILRR